jgi:hypothetical protein
MNGQGTLAAIAAAGNSLTSYCRAGSLNLHPSPVAVRPYSPMATRDPGNGHAPRTADLDGALVAWRGSRARAHRSAADDSSTDESPGGTADAELNREAVGAVLKLPCVEPIHVSIRAPGK